MYQRTGGPLGPVLKILYRSWSVQDLKKTKRTSKDLINDVFKMAAKIKALFLFALCNLYLSNCQKGIRKVTAAKRKRKFKSHVVMNSVMLVLGLLRYFSYNILVDYYLNNY